MNISRTIVACALAGAHLAYAGAASAQACVQRPDLMLCGTSDRSLSGLYSGSGPFNEVSGCAPTANTQAMFVTRYATIAGNGAAWLAYLNAGGRIITEFSTGAEIYNEIYGTAYADGAQSGACYDNPMPSAKLNTGDPFWVANPIPATAPGVEGCGYNLAALVAGEPSVTALGARSVDTTDIKFAIRPQGGGTLFLLEADWQDTNTPVFDANNLAFLDAMISACGGPVAPVLSRYPVPVDEPLALGGLAALVALLGGALARRRRGRSNAA